MDTASAVAQAGGSARPSRPGATPPDTPGRRRALRAIRFAIATIFLVNGTAIGIWAAHIPLLKAALRLSEQRLGLILLGFALGAIGTMLMTGWLSARWGSGRVTVIAGVAFCVALLLPGFAPTAATLMASVIALGMCNGALDVSMNAHATHLERAWGGPIMSSFHAFFSLGGLTGAAISSLFIIRGFGASTTMPLAGLVLGGVVLLTVRTLWPGAPGAHGASTLLDDNGSAGGSAGGTAGGAAAGTADSGGSGGGPRLALPSKGLVRLGAVGFCAAIAEGAMVDWTGVYLSTVLNAAAAFAAAGFAASSLSMTLGRLAGDRIITRLGRRETLIGSGLIAAFGVTIAVLASSPWPAALGFGIAGIGLANIIPIVYADAGHAHPTAPGVGVATVATMGYAGFLLGPPIIGFTAGQVGLRLALILLIVASILISLLGVRHTPQRSP